MAIKINYILNGTQINPPMNWKDTAFEVNFDRDGNAKTRITSTNFDFVRENATTFIDRVYDGATGGFGILEAMPLEVELERNGVIEKPFTGYVDLTKDSVFNKELCKVNATERKSIEWLEEKADGFTFEYLKSIGIITSSDYKYIPYVVNSVPDYKESAIAILTAYVVYQQILEVIEKIKDIIVELTNPATLVSAIIKASLMGIYLATLIIAMVNLIKNIVKQLIQPVKYHACMNVKTLVEKGCQHLGITLSSSILTNTVFAKAYIMPEKSTNPLDRGNEILGFINPDPTQQEGFYKGTFGSLLRYLKDMFNAKLYIQNDVLYFERLDYNLTPAQYVLPDIYQPNYKTNADEFKANYYTTFQTDTIDKNTLQEYEGTAYQVIFSPNISQNSDLVMMKGLDEVRIPFALAKRKTELTIPEQIVKTFLDALSIVINTVISTMNILINTVNNVIGLVNDIVDAFDLIGINIPFSLPTISNISPVNLGNIIENRVNMMKLETDFTSVAKIFLMDLGSSSKFNKLTTGNETIMSAEYLYQNYHYINNFLPTVDKPNGNQYIIKEFNDVRFGFEQYQQVKNNNQVIVGDKIGLIESFKWNPYDQIAYIRIRISTLLTNNINATYLIPSGK